MLSHHHFVSFGDVRADFIFLSFFAVFPLCEIHAVALPLAVFGISRLSWLVWSYALCFMKAPERGGESPSI